MQENDTLIQKIASVLTGSAWRIIVAALMVLALYIAVRFSFAFGYSVFHQDPVEEPPGTDIEITIEKGASIDELADLLEKEGVISEALPFRVQGRLYKLRFYPGTYKLNSSMTVKEVLEKLDMTEAEYEESRAAETAADENAGAVVGGGSEGE